MTPIALRLPLLRFFSLALWLLMLVAGSLYASAQSRHTDSLQFVVMSYNVENLFDTRHDSLKDDYEFLPTSIRHWNYSRYRHKQDNVARVIAAVGQGNMPALVGLCEVENDSVLHYLTRYSPLRRQRYRYLITQSDDLRGIDVALLYRPQLFKPIAVRSLSVPKPRKQFRPTRQVLHVTGLLLNADTLDVFVVHFPSRAGGSKNTEPYRLSAARALRTATDSITRQRHCPQIIVMGDFNDNLSPTSPIARELHLQVPPSVPDSINRQTLYPLITVRSPRQGSYKYQGQWELIDHILVSGKLLQPLSALYISPADASIYKAPFLLTPDARYQGNQPFRTYRGMKHEGGFSDHLPLRAPFTLRY